MNKSKGEDGLTLDLIEGVDNFIHNKVVQIYAKSLQSQRVLTARRNATIILLHQKGEMKDLKKYRPVSLLPVTFILYTEVTSYKISATHDCNQSRKQARYSAIDHIHVTNQMIRKPIEYNKPKYLVFIDLERKKTCDSI